MRAPDPVIPPPDAGLAALVRMDVAAWAKRGKTRPGLGPMLRILWLRPGFHFVFWHRVARAAAGLPGIGRPLARAILFVLEIAFSSEISLAARIGGGLYVPHPFGIVIGGGASIGKAVTILQNVTIGEKAPTDPRKATIGDDAYLGAGAVILGPVTIGRAAIIGANAVVLTDVPATATAVGNPARILPRTEGRHQDDAQARQEQTKAP